MSKLIAILLTIGVFALAFIVAQRMQTETMVLIVGIICGIGISLPVCLITWALLSRSYVPVDTSHRNVHPPAVEQPQPAQYRIVWIDKALMTGVRYEDLADSDRRYLPRR